VFRINGIEFEWDPKKAGANLRKHGLSFRDAATAFGDPFALTFDDPIHSDDEERLLLFGCTAKRRLVVVSFVVRGERNRIITARSMTQRERSIYEQG
jgi:uncharacterized DUF497 family protein